MKKNNSIIKEEEIDNLEKVTVKKCVIKSENNDENDVKRSKTESKKYTVSIKTAKIWEQFKFYYWQINKYVSFNLF